jgi:hypothetical protein
MVTFMLYDPQDPMHKVVEKVFVGERPKFFSSTGKDDDGEESKNVRRHTVGYDVMAKALRKILKGRSLGQIADWLDNPSAWVDPGKRQVYHPGTVVRTVIGVQTATFAWLRNAHNFEDNLWLGEAKGNSQASRKYTSGRDDIKKTWIGQGTMLTNYYKIFCCESSSGRLRSCSDSVNIHPPGTNLVPYLNAKLVFQNPLQVSAGPGARFLHVSTAQATEFDRELDKLVTENMSKDAKRVYEDAFSISHSGQGAPYNRGHVTDTNLFNAIWNNTSKKRRSYEDAALDNLVAHSSRNMGRDLGGSFLRYNTPSGYTLHKVGQGHVMQELTRQPNKLQEAQKNYLVGAIDLEGVRIKSNYENAMKMVTIELPNGTSNNLFELAVGGSARGKYFAE